MAVTVTPLGDRTNLEWGPLGVEFATVALDNSYPSGGYGTAQGLNARAFSMRGITAVLMVGGNTAAAPYFAEWNTQTNKLMIFAVAGFTPAGTISAPTINITGGIGGTVPIGISSDANAAALSKTTATDVAGITGVQAPTFTGSAVAAGVVEVSGSLATLVLTVLVFGIR